MWLNNFKDFVCWDQNFQKRGAGVFELMSLVLTFQLLKSVQYKHVQFNILTHMISSCHVIRCKKYIYCINKPSPHWFGYYCIGGIMVMVLSWKNWLEPPTNSWSTTWWPLADFVTSALDANPKNMQSAVSTEKFYLLWSSSNKNSSQ